MYDFYFGTRKEIEEDPKNWLLTIKRMLPRWPNGIPDTEYIALYDLLIDLESKGTYRKDEDMVLVETGSGASTIILLYFALKWDTELYTWDISSNKLAYLRGLLTDTLFKHYSDKNIFNHWKYVPYDSKSEYVGINVLAELNKKVCGSFFDSDHTWANLKAEIEIICPILVNGGLVSIDDGNYKYKNVNTAYVNMIRAKLGLSSIDIKNNKCAPFWEEVEGLLKKHFNRIENQDGGTYRKTFKSDLFWTYYAADRKNMADLGMEKLNELAHRFDAWLVYND